MTEVGKMGGKKPAGSMLPPGFENDIRTQKHIESVDALAKKQGSVEEEKQKTEEKKFEKEIDELLPKRVVSAYGEIPYEMFKNLYEDVFKAVADKDHFATGYVTHSAKIHDGITIVVRTFRRREGDALRKLLPTPPPMGGQGDDHQDKMRRYITAKILISLQKFDKLEFVEKEKLTADNVEEWFEKSDVKDRLGWLDDLPDEVTGLISMIVDDTMMAYRAALTENLKNRLAPLSRSTD